MKHSSSSLKDNTYCQICKYASCLKLLLNGLKLNVKLVSKDQNTSCRSRWMDLVLLPRWVPEQRSMPPWFCELCVERREIFTERWGLLFSSSYLFPHCNHAKQNRSAHFMINEILWNVAVDLFYVLYSAAALGADRPWWRWWKWPSPHHFPFKRLPALQLCLPSASTWKKPNTWHCKTVSWKRKHRCLEWIWIYGSSHHLFSTPHHLRPKRLFSVTPAHFIF